MATIRLKLVVSSCVVFVVPRFHLLRRGRKRKIEASLLLGKQVFRRNNKAWGRDVILQEYDEQVRIRNF